MPQNQLFMKKNYFLIIFFLFLTTILFGQTINNISATDVSCNGGSNGAIDITSSGFTGPITYSWTKDGNPFAPTTEDITGLSFGTYVLTITDSAITPNIVSSGNITINEPTLLSASASENNPVVCFGESNGSATVIPAGGNGGYTYAWDKSASTSATANDLDAGLHTITITDSKSCAVQTTVTINEPNILSASASENSPVVCFGESNGSATVIPAGGNGGYTYAWDKSASTSATANDLDAGLHTITITDSKSCAVQTTVTINEPNILSASASENSPVVCFGESNGSATVIPAGGNGGYTYAWDKSASTSATANDLDAGLHTITITDSKSCAVQTTVTINEPNILSASASENNPVVCFGESNGSATVIPAGGNGGYTYAWDKSASTSATANDLDAGLHTITITDSKSCAVQTTVTINEPNILSASASENNPVVCFGESNGSATVIPAGGNGGYTYAWDKSASTSATANDLDAGLHTITITDSKSCAVQTTVTINEPNILSASASENNPVVCFGESNGSATVIPAGGNGGYTYAWDKSASTSATANDLDAGLHTITITDSKSCAVQTTVTINEPNILSASASENNPVVCFGESNGSATVIPAGGNGGYTYAWDKSASTSATANDLDAGLHTITITDSKSCAVQTTVTINEPNILSASASENSPVVCFGESNGSATVIPAGGNGGYTYAWDKSASTSATANDLDAGLHTITITDSKSCAVQTTVTINEPNILSASASENNPVVCFGESNGSATVIPAGGNGGYTYAWDKSASTSATANDLDAGLHTITITDSKSCAVQTTVTINEPNILSASASENNPVVCFGESNGSATVIPAGGNGGYTYAWDKSASTSATANDLDAGLHTITITDSKSCAVQTTVTINEPNILSASASENNPVVCFGESNGSATVIPAGGNGGYTYAWDKSASTSATANDLDAGLHTITITDSKSCAVQTTVTINEPNILSASASENSPVVCFGESNGSATVIPAGGNGGYTYAWDKSASTSATANDLDAGLHTITITDSKSCAVQTTVTINEPNILSASASENNPVVCFGESNGSATVIPAGGNGGYTYAWDKSASTSATANDLDAGLHTITITDSKSCAVQTTVTINEPNILSASASENNPVVCFGESNGSATVIPAGGNGGYTYAWDKSASTSATANDLDAGLHTITITDSKSCAVQTTVTINEPNILSASASENNPVVCFGESNGSATVIPAGGNGGYTYAWDKSASTSATANDLDAGLHTITITDSKSCAVQTTVTINEPNILSASASENNPVVCFGESNGSATVIPAGGNGGYTYAWDKSASTSATANDLDAGLHTITITDSKSCAVQTTVTINEPNILSASASENSPVVCFGESNGSATVIPAGGNGGYTYAWDKSASTSATANDLDAGLHTITITDSKSCAVQTTVTINEPNILSASATVTNVDCIGNSTGSINLSVTGGNNGYTYSWSGPSGFSSVSQNISNLSTGNYSLIVSDSKSCTFTLNNIFVGTIPDNENPTITCPSNITLNSDAGNCSAIANFVTPLGADNCAVASVTQTAGPSSGSAFPVGTTQVTFLIQDTSGNTNTCSFNITVVDNENPTASNPTTIVASGSTPAPDINVVIDETDNCTASPVVAFVSDTPSGTCPVIVTRVYSVTDNAGNSFNVSQTITVNDAINPIASCIAPYTLTITLDSVTGEASILANQIDDGSTDNCGTISLILDKDTFGCNDIGPQNVTLTVTDSQGNSNSCQTIITVNAPPINSGTLTGWNMMTETSADAANVVELTACPIDPLTGNTLAQDVELNLTGIDPALTDDINRWEHSTNGGVTWSTLAGTTNTTTTYVLVDVQVTTLVRAVIDVGDCLGFSPVAIISVIPPDIPPTITNGTEFNTICLGDVVTVVVESEYGVGSEVNEGGLFSTANPEGWRINGIDDWKLPASNSNENNFIWAEITNQNGGRDAAGTLYNALDPKYIIVHGDLTDPAIKRKGNPWGQTWSSLETPIFSTYGLTDASLTFDTAYFLEAGAEIKVEISTDGGNTYNPLVNPLDPGINTFNGQPHDFSGPSTSGAGTHMENFVPIAIDLQNYLGLDNVRLRFYFEGGGSTGSSWALDNIQIPNNPVDEVIEWTDDFGVVVTTGSTVNIEPITPGIQIYGATSLINGCRSDDTSGTEFITIETTLSFAGENITPITNECGEDTITLQAYDNSLTAQENFDNGIWDGLFKVPNAAPASPNYPGTNEIGTWTVTAPTSVCNAPALAAYILSDVNDPNATFSGEPGAYTLIWTVNGCASNIQVTINSCSQIDFDGENDYITFKDNYDRTGSFSIEMWVKASDLTGTQSLLSKRDANDLATGYDLRLNGSSVEFRWGNNSISSNAIDATTWHHIAVTFNGSDYKLYIDGVEKDNANGNAPSANTMECILGAMDQANNQPNKPVNYYHGWIDELRIWNKALDVEHIRQMMNQEIILNGGDDIIGEIIPLKIHGPDETQDGIDDDSLLWSNLDGYYRMDINCGYLTPTRGSLNGRLRNINSGQEETAPLPYTSANSGLWNNNNIWEQPVAWYTPNSTVFGTQIDWNIVQIKNNVESGNSDLTVLGLIIDNGSELTIQDPTLPYDETNAGHGLWVTHYLKLNGNIDLVGESQLVQKRYSTTSNPTVQFNESILDVTSSGYTERDQQGTRDFYTYNYWSSPVGISNTISNNNNYTLPDILNDGSVSVSPISITFLTSGYNGTPGTPGVTPVGIADYWIWKYANKVSDTYSQWQHVRSTGNLLAGEGFTMKGVHNSGTSFSEQQNYAFNGKPNNGDISLTLSAGNDYLIGNPYPSAIDADEFILDNISDGAGRAASNIFDGTLYFWDHFAGNTHVLREYQGGYATYTLMGGIIAVSTDTRIDASGAFGTKIPKQYIPVSQGFFVTADAGGSVTFKNSQRIFKTEASDPSLFLKGGNKKNKSSVAKSNDNNKDTRQKIRLMFDSPKGYHRQLLVGIDKNTSNDIEKGYDAPLTENNVEDMFWIFKENNFVIQAVNNFDENQILPIGIKTNIEGISTIKIDDLENITNDIDIYLHDKELNIYHDLKENNYEVYLSVGEYLSRFEITFSNPQTLNTNEVANNTELEVYFSNEKESVVIHNPSLKLIESVEMFNILGQALFKFTTNTNDNYIEYNAKQIKTGAYILKIDTEYGNVSKKVLIE